MESRKSVLGLSVLIWTISVRINAAQFDGQNQRNPQSTNIDKYDILLQRVIRLEVLEAQRQLLSAHPTNNGNKDNIFFRTCNEARLANPLLNSGMYWIDPDGQGIGDNPINVYCDMATGTTSVPHNNENIGFVKQCADPGQHGVQ